MQSAETTGKRLDEGWIILCVVSCCLVMLLAFISGCEGEVSGGAGEICFNQIDDDGDFLPDCDDPDCAGVAPCPAVGSDLPADSLACGHQGEACCTGSICESGLSCLNNQCSSSGGGGDTCGAAQQVCCPGDVCNTGLTCRDYRCYAEGDDCGGHLQRCCEGEVCDDALICLRGTCSPCGEELQPCCTSNQCERGLTCEGERCISGECGGDLQPCCEGDDCDRGLVCSRGSCTQCGEEGQICCTSGCNAGLSCERNHCIDPDGGGSGTDTSNCHLNRDCADCIEQDGCGWCASTDTCMAGSFDGATSGSCSWFDWEYLDCPATGSTCSARSDDGCATCLAEEGCGWCGESNTCMPGDFIGPAEGDCSWLEWQYLDC